MRRDVAQVEPRHRLDGVGVDHHVAMGAAGDSGSGSDVGDRPDLVVDRHHRHHRHVGVDDGGEVLEVDPSAAIDLDQPAVHLFDRVQDGVVLDGRARGEAAPGGDHAEHRGVVALGAAAGEDDVAGLAAEHVGDRVAGVVERRSRLTGEAVRAARVGVLLVEEREHRVDGLAPHGRGGRVVEIDEPSLGARAEHARLVASRISRHVRHATDER